MTKKKRKGSSKIGKIAKKAKKIRKARESWKHALKRAAKKV
jgi:hypothetical protein